MNLLDVIDAIRVAFDLRDKGHRCVLEDFWGFVWDLASFYNSLPEVRVNESGEKYQVEETDAG